MLIKNFEDLDLFKLGRELVKEIYHCASNDKFRRDFGLREQIQRASVSIILNIAEGFDSGSRKSITTFLRYSFRSASEVRAILYIALDLDYITRNEFDLFKTKLIRLQQMISNFIKYLAID